jgi:SH3-like domain-containing protein
MKERIEKAIAQLAAANADRRLHLFRVQLDSVSEGIARFSGKVLEQSTLTQLADLLRPQVRADTSAVQVLRRESPSVSFVATNLTDLHVEPSFLSELLTQVLHGAELEVLEEKDRWCLVRRGDGYLGWAYKPYLSPATSDQAAKPSHLICVPCAEVFAEPSLSNVPRTRLLAGTSVHVSEMSGQWSRLALAGDMLPGGWTATAGLRPLAPLPAPEKLARPQMVHDARRFVGVYYLWGGNTAFGLDCSALAQLAHTLSGYAIPRDADLQFQAARKVEPPFQAGDLLFFSAPGSVRKITHVGISVGGWTIIHSSRGRNGVYVEDVQASETMRQQFAGAGTFLS